MSRVVGGGSGTSYSQRPARTPGGPSARRPSKIPQPALAVIDAENRWKQRYSFVPATASFVVVRRFVSVFSRLTHLLCTDCTYAHFQHTAECPTCRRVLKEKDFLELNISKELSPNVKSFEKFSFTHLLTKTTSGSTQLHLHEMCVRSKVAIRQCEREMNFMLKQIRMTCRKMAGQTHGLSRNLKAVQDDNKRLQQSWSSEKAQAQEALKDMKSRLEALQREIVKNEKVLEEKDVTISVNTWFVNSYGSNGNHGERRRSNDENKTTHYRSPHEQGRGPIHGYMHKKEMQEQQERAQRDGYSNAKPRRPVLGHASN
eukprot:CAMPEP_0168756538 /NCGR_PEP_ID=MMETSP0724-20121128/20668_1 /TAXON_ID=265536 /ORGANISM="Amphiprora sp., Strain CCMP467" /LENGTH=314 /DNA_ID=CAMNT_0008805251 /DNA_START=150 /DNA_END=1093 /DNA_ORIENTATION=-